MNSLIIYDLQGKQNYCLQVNQENNTSELMMASGPGIDHAIKIVFYNPYPDKVKSGITVNSAEVLSEEIKDLIFPGQETHFSLIQSKQTVLNTPINPCNETKGYRQNECVFNCAVKNISDTCGCDFPKECQQKKDCIMKALEIRSSYASYCFKKCPQDCNQVTYPLNRIDIDLNMIEDEFKKYKQMISRNFNIIGQSDEDTKKKMTDLLIYYKGLDVNTIKQSESISLTSLISNVGGLLGKTFLFYIFLF